jgi:hypothetical protein
VSAPTTTPLASLVDRRVLEADPAASPDDPLANTIAQRRAKLLLAHADDLFD